MCVWEKASIRSEASSGEARDTSAHYCRNKLADNWRWLRVDRCRTQETSQSSTSDKFEHRSIPSADAIHRVFQKNDLICDGQRE